MRKFILPLMAVGLISLSALAARAAETEPVSTPKPALTEKSSSTEANPSANEVGQSPASLSPKTPGVKIGVIDMAKIAGESASGKAVHAKIKAKVEKVQKQIKSKETQLKKQKAEIESQMPSLAPIQRSAKANEFQKKLDSFQSFIQKAEKDIRTAEAELLKNLYESVAKSAADYGNTNGFAAIVINKELLFAGSSVAIQDLTAEIIKLIDGSGKK